MIDFNNIKPLPKYTKFPKRKGGSQLKAELKIAERVKQDLLEKIEKMEREKGICLRDDAYILALGEIKAKLFK